jgi:cytochrome P450
MPESNLTVFSSFDECDEVLRHPASASDGMKSTVVQRQIAEGTAFRPLGPPGFLFLDPPDHTRLRKLVTKAFVPKVVKALEPDITAMVDGLLDDVAPAGHFDGIADLAYPLPVAVTCRLLGVPLEDEPKFSHASALLARALDPFNTLTGESAEVSSSDWRRGDGCASTSTGSSRPRRMATSSRRTRSSRPATCCSSRATRPLST